MKDPDEDSASANNICDETLIMNVQDSCQFAFSILYDRHASILLNFLNNFLGDHAVAEEALQEVFWRIWDRATLFNRAHGNFRTWMFSIARHYAIDLVRRQNARPRSVANDSAIYLFPSESLENDVAKAVETRLNARAIQRVLAALPSEQRQVIIMSYFEGITHREIATVTDTPIGTIHTRARLALNQLQQRLPIGFEG